VNWSPGETIVLQGVLRNRVWEARPQTVIRDDGDLLVLWFPRGTQWKAPATPPSRPDAADRGTRMATNASLGDWAYADAEWDVDTLSLTRPDDWHSVWISWPPDGSAWGWYVNLQRPFRRTRLGIETMDLMLDVLIDPDRTWRWKDEDELETFVVHGIFDQELAAQIRAEGLHVVERAQRNDPPFSEPWRETFRPDPTWDPPELPDGWDRVCR